MHLYPVRPRIDVDLGQNFLRYLTAVMGSKRPEEPVSTADHKRFEFVHCSNGTVRGAEHVCIIGHCIGRSTSIERRGLSGFIQQTCWRDTLHR